MLYFAYGSNLDYVRMINRCNECEVIGATTLEGYRLVFMENNNKKIVANIIKNKKFKVYGVLYNVTNNDIRKLDMYEGHPYVYKKTKIKVEYMGKEVEAITYIMNKKCEVYSSNCTQVFNRQYGVPKRDYFQYLLNGYNMYSLPQNELMESYVYSKDKNKNSWRNRKMSKTVIFVYGTLKRGYSNHRFMEGSKYLGEGNIENFDIYTVGHHGGFPAIIDGSGEVYGELYEVPNKNMPFIDRLEGYHGENDPYNMYDRKTVNVNMDGKLVSAYVYVWNEGRSLPIGSNKLINRF